MGAATASPVRYAADESCPPEREATTAIIAQTVSAVCIWTLSLEIGKQTAEGSWTRWAFGSEKMASGRSSTDAGDAGI